MQYIAQNRKARFNYNIIDTYEAGIVLLGSEVKSLRNNKCNIGTSHVVVENNEAWLLNMDIANYSHSTKDLSHYPLRKRKLLLNRKQINKLHGATQLQGMTTIALNIYFNKKQKVKLTIALAKGKDKADKRSTERDRDWQREKERLFKK